MVWCADCKYFGEDCSPEFEDYGKPCEAYENKTKEDNEEDIID